MIFTSELRPSPPTAKTQDLEPRSGNPQPDVWGSGVRDQRAGGSLVIWRRRTAQHTCQQVVLQSPPAAKGILEAVDA